MPNWRAQFRNLIRDLPSRGSPRWPWPLRKVRKANIPDTERDIFERYGETVISMQVSGSFTANPQHARAWLTERADYHERRERWISGRDLFLEIVIIALIGWEIHEGRQQAKVLQHMDSTAAETAKILASLQSTTELMLHVSERAYVHATPSLRKPPSSRQKLQLSVVATNAGRTSALDLEVHSAAAFVSSSIPVNDALNVTLAPPAQTPVSVTVLESGQNTEAPSESPRELNESALQQLMRGNMVLYVFSTLTYKDVFQQPHRTEICAVYQPKTNAFMNCREHNHSD